MSGDRVGLPAIERVEVGTDLLLEGEAWTVIDRSVSSSQYVRLDSVELVLVRDGRLRTLTAPAGEKVRPV